MPDINTQTSMESSNGDTTSSSEGVNKSKETGAEYEDVGSLRSRIIKKTPSVNKEKTEVNKEEDISKSGQDQKDTSTESGNNKEPEKKYKVKIGDIEKEVTAEELIKNYQLETAARQKMTEAAQLRKQSEEFIKILRTNPLKIMRDPNLGLDVKKLAEEYLYEIYSEENLSPQEKETREKLKRLEELETEKKKSEELAQQERQNKLVEKYQQEYEKDISEALSESGLPKTKGVLNRIIYYMHQSLQEASSIGNEPLKAKDVIKLVKQDLIEETKDLYGNLDGDILAQMMGDGVMKKIRKYDLEKVKSKNKSVPERGSKGVSLEAISNKPSGYPKSKSLSKEDWKTKLDRIKNGDE